MTLREELLILLDRLPDDITIEDFQYHVYVLDKMKNGQRSIQASGGLSQEEIEKRFEPWLRT
ncbi:MAG TPA: hypothetical protein VFE58_16480 [Tepidisphaeraceae bacterium]|jgi:hypothetical protein|nr:hypothetical protein [Tepidisphaeraceae bacterium]